MDIGNDEIKEGSNERKNHKITERIVNRSVAGRHGAGTGRGGRRKCTSAAKGSCGRRAFAVGGERCHRYNAGRVYGGVREEKQPYYGAGAGYDRGANHFHGANGSGGDTGKHCD